MPNIGHADLKADYQKGRRLRRHVGLRGRAVRRLRRHLGQHQLPRPPHHHRPRRHQAQPGAPVRDVHGSGRDFKFTENGPDVTGDITKLKPTLGKIADAFKGAKVEYKNKDISVDPSFDLARAPGLDKVLKQQSLLELKYEQKVLKIGGTLRPKDLYDGTIAFDDKSQITVGWASNAPTKVDVAGTAHADIKQLATVDLTVKANSAGGGDPASFDLDGHIDATGLNKYIKKVKFGAITGDIHAHVGDKQNEFKVTVDADVVGIPAANINDCQAHIHAEFEKNKGLSGDIHVDHIKVGDVIASGDVKLKDNKFDSGSIHVAADFPVGEDRGRRQDRRRATSASCRPRPS